MYMANKFKKKNGFLQEKQPVNGLIIDLLSDFDKMIEAQLYLIGIIRKNPADPVMDYFRYIYRLISQKPRRVVYSKEFQCPPEYKNELAFIVTKISEGSDLKPFMSKRIMDLSQEQDTMLSDWGIFHLHLSMIPDNRDNRFYARSDQLLLLRVDEETAYLLTTIKHKGVQNMWTLKNYLEIVHSNWPESIVKYKLEGMRLSPPISESEHAVLRKTHAVTGTELSDGTLYLCPGGGYSSDGTPTLAVCDADFWVNRIREIERCLVENAENFFFHNQELVADTGIHEPIELHLVAIQGVDTFYVFVIEPQLCFVLKIEKDGRISTILTDEIIVPKRTEAWIVNTEFFRNT